MNESPLWQRKHLLRKQSSSWSSAAVKRTDSQTVHATAGNQAWIAPTSVVAVTVIIPVRNACEDTDTLKIEYEDPDSEE